jgi:transposase-like protein
MQTIIQKPPAAAESVDEQTVYLERIESAMWPNGPVCPYCFNRIKIVSIRNQARYHCNACSTGFSVTVNTFFHDTKLPFKKWFAAIELLLEDPDLTALQMKQALGVTYKTAWYLSLRIKRTLIQDRDLLERIIKSVELQHE